MSTHGRGGMATSGADVGAAARRISRKVSTTPVRKPSPASIAFCLTRLFTSCSTFSVVCTPKTTRIRASSSSSSVSASMRLRLKTASRLSLSAWRVFCSPDNNRPKNLPSAMSFSQQGAFKSIDGQHRACTWQRRGDAEKGHRWGGASSCRHVTPSPRHLFCTVQAVRGAAWQPVAPPLSYYALYQCTRTHYSVSTARGTFFDAPDPLLVLPDTLGYSQRCSRSVSGASLCNP